MGRCAPGKTRGDRPLESSNLTQPFGRFSQPAGDCGSRVQVNLLARHATERGWSYSGNSDSDLISVGRLQLPPDDSIPIAGLGDKGMLAWGEDGDV